MLLSENTSFRSAFTLLPIKSQFNYNKCAPAGEQPYLRSHLLIKYRLSVVLAHRVPQKEAPAGEQPYLRLHLLIKDRLSAEPAHRFRKKKPRPVSNHTSDHTCSSNTAFLSYLLTEFARRSPGRRASTPGKQSTFSLHGTDGFYVLTFILRRV